MYSKERNKRVTSLILGLVFGLAGLLTLIYLWNVLGERGLYADETRTAGYTTPLDVIMMIVACGCIIASIVFLVKARLKK